FDFISLNRSQSDAVPRDSVLVASWPDGRYDNGRKREPLMPQSLTTTPQLQLWIERLRAGNDSARDQPTSCCAPPLFQLHRKMLKRYPRVKRWEQTDDVLQNVSLRLRRTLTQVTPNSVLDFLRLASLNIRRELLDLVKHYYGPRGMGMHHHSDAGNDDDTPTH